MQTLNLYKNKKWNNLLFQKHNFFIFHIWDLQEKTKQKQQQQKKKMVDLIS